uniref:Protein-tyrosine-phosphatase n=1 Tax=Aureoumbra lagunensis TaxID=44058 RepID=A0A7S3JR71_9STRA
MPPLTVVVPQLSEVPRSSDDSALKREALELYQNVLSEVLPKFLFVSGREAAEDLTVLEATGITHIINCGTLVKEMYIKKMKYLALAIPDDGNACDISWGFQYQVIDFIEGAWESGGRVLIHCTSGVSRSCALAIAYLMWRDGPTSHESYEQYRHNFGLVKLARPICDPNPGFAFQLTSWADRRQAITNHTFSGLFRAAYMPLLPEEAQQAQNFLNILPSATVIKLIRKNDNDYHSPALTPLPTLLDPRTAFLILVRDRLALWIGKHCPSDLAHCAHTTAQWLHTYDSAPKLQFQICQGEETTTFWSLFPFDANRSISSGLEAYDADIIRPEWEPTKTIRTHSQKHDVNTLESTVKEEVSRLPHEKPQLFEFSPPNIWDRIVDYDHNDLVDDAIFLLRSRTNPTFLWLGTAVREDDIPSVLIAAVGFDSLSEIEIIRAGNETDFFWNIFEAGY